MQVALSEHMCVESLHSLISTRNMYDHFQSTSLIYKIAKFALKNWMLHWLILVFVWCIVTSCSVCHKKWWSYHRNKPTPAWMMFKLQSDWFLPCLYLLSVTNHQAQIFIAMLQMQERNNGRDLVASWTQINAINVARQTSLYLLNKFVIYRC